MGYFLPKKYKELHSLCFYLHDILAQVVIEGEKKKLFDTVYRLKKRSGIGKLKDNDDILKWLINNGYEEEFKSIVIKQVLIATISDYCHYIYEALKCSEKNKLCITYTLLRKPLKDNLLLFEWIMMNRNEFMENFQKDSNCYAIDKIDSTKKKMFIECSVNQINYCETFDADFIYNIRYSKKTDYSLERVWNIANHIVTTLKYYKTESLNLNFVFSGDNSKESQWNYLYSVLPYLLFYTVEVIQVVLDREIGENKLDILFETFEKRAKKFGKTVPGNLYKKI
ncbi:hypothetical protein ES708_01240 [subsurface metagenome]